MSATVKYSFHEGRAGAGAPKRLKRGAGLQVAGKVSRVARLLALAHKFQKMLDSGEVESMAELARLGRVSRARITQIMDLLMLAPEIQEDVLFGGVDMPLRDTMRVARCVPWDAQHEMRNSLVGPQGKKAA